MRFLLKYALPAFGAVAILTAAYALPAAVGGLSGDWYGEFNVRGESISCYATIISSDDGTTAQFVFPDIDRVASVDLAADSDSVLFSFAMDEVGTLSASGSIREGRIFGSVIHGGSERPFFLRRLYRPDTISIQKLTGFYRDTDGGSLCVMYRARGGVTYYDFDELAVGSRYPIGESEYARFDDQGNVSTQWKIVADDNGVIIGIEIVNADGTTEYWPRIDDVPFAQENVTYSNGNIRLAGVLLKPTGTEESPAIVYIHGSGANNTRNDYYDLYICQFLASNGIAVLLPDKRGSGESGGDWRMATMEDFAADAIAGVEFLRKKHGVDSQRVGVLGFSQGGQVTPIVAAAPAAVAFAVNVSGSALPLAETVTYEVEQLAHEAGLSGDDLARVIKLQKDAIAFVQDSISWDSFETELRRATETEWPGLEIASGFPQQRDHWKWRFHRHNAAFDPIVYWKRVAVPSLIVYGQKDTQVPVGESLIRLDQELTGEAASSVEVEVYRNSGHGIGDPETGWISGEFLEALAGWIKKQGR